LRHVITLAIVATVVLGEVYFKEEFGKFFSYLSLSFEI
jgi:hypothetical protein